MDYAEQAASLIRKIEEVFVQEDVGMQEAFNVLAILAALNANNLNIPEKDFLHICSTIYQSDKDYRRTELQ